MNDNTLICPECKRSNLVKFGKKFSNRKEVQQYLCKSCGRITIHPIALPHRDRLGRFTTSVIDSSASQIYKESK